MDSSSDLTCDTSISDSGQSDANAAPSFTLRFDSGRGTFPRTIQCPFEHLTIVDSEVTDLLKQQALVESLDLRFGAVPIHHSEIVSPSPRADFLNAPTVVDALKGSGLSEDEVETIVVGSLLSEVKHVAPRMLNELQMRTLTFASHLALRAKVLSFDKSLSGAGKGTILTLIDVLLDRMYGSRQVFLLSYTPDLPMEILRDSRVVLAYSASPTGSGVLEPDVKQNIRHILRQSGKTLWDPEVITFPQFLPAASVYHEELALETISNPETLEERALIDVECPSKSPRKPRQRDTLTGAKKASSFKSLLHRIRQRRNTRWPSEEILVASAVPSEKRREQFRQHEKMKRIHQMLAVTLLVLFVYLLSMCV